MNGPPPRRRAASSAPSRGGALFPHLYDVLPLHAVRHVDPLPLSGDGTHLFPPLES